MAAELDEPPEAKSPKAGPQTLDIRRTSCAKATCKKESLLTHYLHASESNCISIAATSQLNTKFSCANSTASTCSRGSATSVGELTSDDGHISPRSSTPSPPIPSFQHLSNTTQPFLAKTTLATATTATTATTHTTTPARPQLSRPQLVQFDSQSEKQLEARLGRKRCIMFACPTQQSEKAKQVSKLDVQVSSAVLPNEFIVKEDSKNDTSTQRPTVLNLICPTSRPIDKASKVSSASIAPIPNLTANAKCAMPSASPVPPIEQLSVSNSGTSPTINPRKLALRLRKRRESIASDISHTEATRFYEFATSEEEVEDWTREPDCFQSRLTVGDTLQKEYGLRKLGREVEAELEEEQDEENAIANEIDDEDDEDDDEDEDEDKDEEGIQETSLANQKLGLANNSESDEGFHSDDEQGFAHSEDESDNDWWTPSHHSPLVHSRSRPQRRQSHAERRDSTSTIDSIHPNAVNVPLTHMKRLTKSSTTQEPELPDSTDFVCGTVDEDKPLEQAYLNHLEQRRLAKRKIVPQDIDPTFPTSDLELIDDEEEDEEEDEVSEHGDGTETDVASFLPGTMAIKQRISKPKKMSHSDSSGKADPKQDASLRNSSPSLLCSPPSKKAPLHRSPPPARRARSPAPCGYTRFNQLSTSLPRRPFNRMATSTHAGKSIVMDEEDNTPRFNRGAIDIVMGLGKKKQRRREKLYKTHCRKAQLKARDRKFAPGKGVEKMRDLGLAVHAYRGKNQSSKPLKDNPVQHVTAAMPTMAATATTANTTTTDNATTLFTSFTTTSIGAPPSSADIYPQHMLSY